MSSALRFKMLSTTSVVVAAGAAFGWAPSAAAQTVCSTVAPTTTTNVSCVNGTAVVATGTTDLTTTVNATPQGLSVSSPSAIIVNLTPGAGGNTISTNLGTTPALSVNGGSTVNVAAPSVNFATTNLNSDAVDLTGTDVTATLGNLSTTGANANALLVNATGTTSITMGTGTTTGQDADVVVINGGTGPTTFTSGNLSSTGAFSDAVRINSTGALTATTGNVSTAGDQSSGVLVGSQAALNLTTGSVTTTGASNSVGVSAQAVGANTVTINGPISTLGTNSYGLQATGLSVNATFRNVTTAGANSNGVVLTGTSGAVTVSQASGSTTSTTGAASNGVTINGIGINGTLGNVSATGAGSRGVILSTSGAPIALTVGNVASASTGVTATTLASPTSITLTTGTIQTTEANAAGAQITAAGPVTFTSGVITTAGANSDGVNVVSTTGPVSVTIGGASTAGANSQGIDVTAAGATTVRNNGTISTTGAGSSGIVVANTTGTTSVTNTTATVTGADSLGIDVATTGTGAVTVSTGAVSQTGANTAAVPSFAAVRVIAAGAAPVTVTATSNVSSTNGSGIWAQSGGTSAVVINSGSTVQGGVAGVQLAGTTGNTLTVNGTLQGTGTGQALIIAGTAGSTVTVGSTGVVNGRFTLSGGNDVVVNNGTMNTAGVLDFGAGTDSFTNAATGTVNLTAATTLTGLETFSNAGRINLNTFTLTGPAVAFNNTGTIDTNGGASLAGFTSFSNAGTLDLAAGTFTVPAAVFTNTGTILADEGATTITGQTNFANSGTINLRDGATGDVLTINSNYVGSGSSNLLIDVAGNTSDRLVITGAASGTTVINPTILAGSQINVAGNLVVDNGTSAANAFTLGTVTNSNPLVSYSLAQQGADYYLVAAPTAAIANPLQVGTLARSLWYQSADEVIARTRVPVSTVGVSFWGQIYADRDKIRDEGTQTFGTATVVSNNRLKTTRYGIQAGVDYGFGGGLIGLTGGYGHAKTDSNTDLDLRAKGWNIGVYGQFGGETGAHGEFLAKHDRYKIDLNNGLFNGLDSTAKSNGIDGSVGYRFGASDSAIIDANVGASWVRTKLEDFTAYSFVYNLDTVKSLRGRAGLRATFGGSLAPYIDGTVYREFKGDSRIALLDGSNTYGLSTEGKGTWFRLEGGVAGRPNGLMLAAWADLGDRKGFGARAGFRFGGAPVVAPIPPAPPAPPAPPPVAPPATQTCQDGSVILATDSCPVPPPPPPAPEPAPERG